MFGERLKRARIKSSLSMQELSNNSNNIVSKQAISQYEKNEKNPSSKVLISLANALGVGVEYFFRNVSVEINRVDFRKQSTFAKKKQESIKEKVREYLERYIQLEEILELESNFNNPLSNEVINSYDDIEELAIKLREKWDLGLDPISNIIEMLEVQNIKVMLVDEEKKFNGLCGEANDDKNHPFIVLNNTSELPNDRKRFTALHELAHIILPNHKLDEERASDRFAGAFLFPKNSVFDEFGEKRNKISIEELNHCKLKYGISIAAIIYRLNQLGVVSDGLKKRFFIKNSSHKFDERCKYEKIIKTSRFDNLLAHAYSEELISTSKLSELASLKVDEALKKYGEIL
jgi:Zn-dependent peptidase ImmA (M78 family)/DNA-binding XRE family transcriptional regulator